MRAHGTLFARAIGVDLKSPDRATSSYRINQQRVPCTPSNLVPTLSWRWIAQPGGQVGKLSGSASTAAAAAIKLTIAVEAR